MPRRIPESERIPEGERIPERELTPLEQAMWHRHQPHREHTAAEELYVEGVRVRQAAERYDEQIIAIVIGTIQPEYKKHITTHYHVLFEEFSTCQQIATGKVSELPLEDVDYHNYCDKRQQKLVWKLKVLEAAHPWLKEYSRDTEGLGFPE